MDLAGKKLKVQPKTLSSSQTAVKTSLFLRNNFKFDDDKYIKECMIHKHVVWKMGVSSICQWIC